ncbi:MAG: hypothetical protein N2747_11130 [Chitinophagaceae bacterium]|nr:hypothetical protein [Chitinophagaceae bacterium]
MKNNMLNKNNFIPDTTFRILFPWKDVIACFDKKLESENYKNHNKCPKCGRSSEELVWIEFRSPDWTWKNLCGRKGPLSICPECKIQVEFILKIMS